MREGWKKCRLGDVVDINPREILKKETLHSKVCMDAVFPFTKKINKVIKEKYKGGVKFRNGDTLLARITPCLENGKTAFVDILENSTVAFGSTEFIVLREKHLLSNKSFIYYFAISPQFRKIAISSMSGSSGRQRVQTDVITNYLFNIPPLPEQEAIAEILSSLDDKIDLLHRQNKTLEKLAESSLDDKIDLLHRQNKTLEKLAETLFKHYFIENKDDSWKEGRLGDITDIAIGRTPPRKEFKWFSQNNNDIKWISIKDLGNNGVFTFNTSEYLTKEAIEKFRVPVITQDTVILSFKMTVGRVAITSEDMVSNEAIAHFKIKNTTVICKEFLYLFLKQFKYNILGSTSSIVTSINSGMIKKILLFIPSERNMLAFKNQVEEIFNKIKKNQQQIQTLEKQRDLLLPKLISGEIRVNIIKIIKIMIKFFKGNKNFLENQENNIELIKKDINKIFSSSHLSFLLGAGCSSGAIPTMTDLFKKLDVNLIEKEVPDKVLNNKNLEKMLQYLYAKEYISSLNEQNETKTIRDLIKEIKKLVFDAALCKVKQDDDNIKIRYSTTLEIYKSFYKKLMYRENFFSKINIFTTNYDLFSEKAMDDLRIIYCNGFSGNINRCFNPMTFNYAYAEQIGLSDKKYHIIDKYIYLYKLHGSINWIEEANENKLFKIKEIQNPSFNNDDNNIMIYPTPTKQNSSFASPYSDLFREFQKKLLQPDNILVVIGYSFADEHINNIIYQALATIPKFRLIIFSYADIEKNKELKKIKDFDDPRIWILEGIEGEGKNISDFSYIIENFLLESNEDDERLETILNKYLFKNDSK